MTATRSRSGASWWRTSRCRERRLQNFVRDAIGADNRQQRPVDQTGREETPVRSTISRRFRSRTGARPLGRRVTPAFRRVLRAIPPASASNNYADQIYRILQATIPTEFVRQGVASNSDYDDRMQSDLMRFFRNAPRFDFREGPVNRYLEMDESKLTGVADKQATRSELNRLQRVFRLAPDVHTDAGAA